MADDDPTIRLLARAVLEPLGFGVAEAENGAMALERFEQLRPELLLLDINMPEVDGYTVCVLLRRTPGGAHTPILVMTAPEDTEAIHRAFEVGATDFVTKPINWALLGYRVRYALRDSTRILLEVASTVSSTLELPEVLRRMTRELVRLVHATSGAAWLLSDDQKAFQPVAAYHVPKHILEDLPNWRYTVTGELGVLTQQLREPIFIPNSQSDPRLSHPLFRLISHKSVLVLPLRGRSITRGAIWLAWTGREHSLTPEELRLCAAIVSQTHAAIENALLHAEIRSRDDQLRQSHKLEAIGRLVGGVAHDFNNLLAVPLMQSELLLRDLGAHDVRRKRVEDIGDAAKHASLLISQLLVLSRRNLLAAAIVNLNDVVENLTRLLGRVIGEDVQLEVIKGPDLWSVVADSGQMDQVIMNLAVNARDAMPDGGRLTIKTANVRVDGSLAAVGDGIPPGDYVALFVRDTGIGMDAETQRRIFEPFFTTKEANKGTGIGLSTVHGIATQAGGFIRVDSAVGRGSTFTVFLPRTAAAAGGVPSPAKSPAPPCGSETVLLVEDHDAVRRAVADTLEHGGYRVLAAGSGLQAIDLSRQAAAIDLLLTDVVMPGLSGIELADRLKGQFPGTRTLYMSGYADVIVKALARTGTRILQKPFAPRDLLQAVRESLDVEAGRPG